MHAFREITSSNGLVIKFSDHTSRYFGDFNYVRIEVVCEVPISLDHEAASVLGPVATFRRTLSKMAVPSGKVPEVIDQLVEDFGKAALPYISAPSFAESLILAELTKSKKKPSHFHSSYGS